MYFSNFVLFIIFLITINGGIISAKSSEFLDKDKKYKLSWEIDMKAGEIFFEVEVSTTGFIGLGISPSGQMDGSDIFIGGVKAGTPYFSDYHGVGNSLVLDEKTDWTLLKARENVTHTSVEFSRTLNTCDDEDYPITEGTTKVIWAFSDSDQVSYHGFSRGVKSFNFFSQEHKAAETNLSKFKEWVISVEATLLPKQTSYICSIHKGPSLKRKHHVIGYNAFLPDSNSVKHTHHWIVYKCKAPNGQTADSVFGQFDGKNGSDCFLPPKAQPYPVQFCTDYFFVWATGGKMTLFPEDIGYSIGEVENDNDGTYYMFEVHYNNPQGLSNVRFNTGVKVYYTEQIRPIEGGLFGVGADPTAQLTLPPDTKDFIIASHCPAKCSEHLQPEGVSIFSILLHSHLAGRKLKVRQFRNGAELPWMSNDDHYDFNFQQNTPLLKVLKYLPGDHLTVECLYDTTHMKGKAIVGGYATTEEMCNAYFWYYPKMFSPRLDYCGSGYPWDKTFEDFGFTNITIEEGRGTTPMLWAPRDVAGLDYKTAINTKFNWTLDFITQQRQKRRFEEQEFVCGDNQANSPPFSSGMTKYPEVKMEYASEDKCKASNNSCSNLVWILLLLVCLVFIVFLAD